VFGSVFAALIVVEPCAGQQNVTAPGGVAAGRDIVNSPINIYNRDPDEIKRLAQQLDRSEGDRRAAEAKAADLARQLDLSDVTMQTVVGFLRILGRQPDLKPEQVPAKMAEITANYMQMQERLAALSPQDPTAADLARQAAEAGRAGHFEEADRLLEQAEARETAAIDEHRVKAAELRAARGDNAATQLHYTDAARHYEAAAALLPPSVSDAKAVYLSRAGDMRQTSGDLAAALTSYRAAHYIFERLAKADPNNAGWQQDLAISQQKIGDVQQTQGNLAAALTSYQASLAIRERLAKAALGNAVWQRDLAVSLDKIGDVQQTQGNLAAALTSYQASLAIRERLAKADPGNAGWQRELSVSQQRIADVQVARGDLAAALTSYQAFHDTFERLAEADPSNSDWQRDLSISHAKIGDMQQAQGNLATALTSYRPRTISSSG
jgi:tetratricopeptide (TPR) repeat protein